MQRVLRLTGAAALAATIVLVAPRTGDAALQPNDSVFLYANSLGGSTGTIHNGTYTQVRDFFEVGNGFTASAMSRDTLLLLNTSSGQLRLATLTAGNFNFVADSHVTKGFTKLTASCDSVLFYNPGTGQVATAKVSAGVVDFGHISLSAVPKSFTSINASCDTVTFLNSKGAGIIGTLAGGAFTKKGAIKTGITNPLVVHTDTSFLRFSTSSHKTEWGTSSNGVEHVTTGPLIRITATTKLAGTATSVLFYDAKSGQGETDELVNGVMSNFQNQSFLSGIQLIVGGR